MGNLLRKKSVLLVALESTIGTAESLTGSDGSMYASNVEWSPEAEETERMWQGTASKIATNVGARMARISGQVELHGSGTVDTSPDFSKLMAMAGFIETTAVWTPKTSVPGTTAADPRTGTMAVNRDGRLQLISGAVCERLKFILEAGQKGIMEFEAVGKMNTPTSDAALPAPTIPTQNPPRASALTWALGSYPLRIQRIEIDVENTVVMRKDLTEVSAYAFGTITDRTITITITPEAQLAGDAALYDAWINETLSAFTAELGGATWNKVEFDAPKAQITSPQEGDNDGLMTDQITLLCTRDSANDDEFVISFTAGA